MARTGSQEEVTVWCSNDYLGMGRNSHVLETMKNTLSEYGAGAGGTRNIAGNNALHLALEAEVADLHRKPAGLIFSSCYVANDATLATLGSKLPNCVFLSDSSNHASMIEGIKHSRAQKLIFKHNDLVDLENKLAALPKDQPKIIAFESVYSMCGSVAPIEQIVELAEKYGAITFLDEVHAVVSEHKKISSGGSLEGEGAILLVTYLLHIPDLTRVSPLTNTFLSSHRACMALVVVALPNISIMTGTMPQPPRPARNPSWTVST